VERVKTVPRRTDQKLYTKKTPHQKSTECGMYSIFYSDDADGRYREIETPDETAEDRPLREKPDQGQLHDPQPRHDLQLKEVAAVLFCVVIIIIVNIIIKKSVFVKLK
jgi:hypothetical protein